MAPNVRGSDVTGPVLRVRSVELSRSTRLPRPAATAAGLAGRWTQSPVLLGTAAALVAATFSLLRTVVAGRGNVASFIVVGSQHVTGPGLPKGVPVVAGSGYDGQFYYRLALDPLSWGGRTFGITFDTLYRVARIGYPALAWLLAGGNAGAVPFTLVAVNVAALGAATWLAAVLARDAGRHAAWGLLVAGYWGFLWTLGRDLTELVTTVGVLGALVALRRDRPVVAGLALALAVLSRETALVLVGAVLISRIVSWAHRIAGRHHPRSAVRHGPPASGPGRRDAAWLLPLAAFVGWESAVRAREGRFPLLASGQSNRGAPFAGIVDGIRHYVPRLPSTGALLWVGEFAVLVIVIGCAASTLLSSRTLLHERLAWVGFGLLGISLAVSIWTGDVGFRSLDDWFVMSGVVLLFTPVDSRRVPARMLVPAVLVAATWVVVFVELVLFI